MIVGIQQRVYQVLKEASYNGKSSESNMEVIDDRVFRKSTGSNVPDKSQQYDDAVYNYVAQELSVGVNVLQGFAEEYNIDVERVALQLRNDRNRVAYMKRAVQNGSEKDAIRMSQAYPGPLRRRDRRRRRRG